MSDVVIHVENLGKRYKIGERERYLALRDIIARAASAPLRLFRARKPSSPNGDLTHIWALKDVSFDIHQGEVVGIIGRNGAGKTTLLKILARVTKPTTGFADVRGRMGSLLEVGTGFHPELTGRENVFLSGAILGMGKVEIQRKFDEIAAFSEVEKFIDTPLKHYSSGMQMRLAFAVAAHLDPEILLVDEVLAVGDTAFQNKCLGKMGDVARRGRTILFVSHNMASISRLCSRAILLDRGRLAAVGPAARTVEEYVTQALSLAMPPLEDRKNRQGTGALRFTRFELSDEHNRSSNIVTCGQNVLIRLGYEALNGSMLRNVIFSLAIYSIYGQHLTYCDNEMAGVHFDVLAAHGTVVCRLRRLALTPGSYDVNIHCSVNGVDADYVPHAGRIIVEGGDFFGSGKLPPPTHGGFLADQGWLLEH